jgi:DNA replication ATP-dependent helicase Dna2
LAARGQRVLITSYTHAAVDNVALKLIEQGLATNVGMTGLPILVRVGRKSSSHSGVGLILASELALRLDMRRNSALAGPNEFVDDLELPSASSLRTVISSAKIVCTTALSVPRTPLLLGENFDVVIVDEAGQISQPAILGALMKADSFVLVGDHLQLPPLVNSEIAEQGGKLLIGAHANHSWGESSLIIFLCQDTASQCSSAWPKSFQILSLHLPTNIGCMKIYVG